MGMNTLQAMGICACSPFAMKAGFNVRYTSAYRQTMACECDRPYLFVRSIAADTAQIVL